MLPFWSFSFIFSEINSLFSKRFIRKPLLLILYYFVDRSLRRIGCRRWNNFGKSFDRCFREWLPSAADTPPPWFPRIWRPRSRETKLCFNSDSPMSGRLVWGSFLRAKNMHWPSKCCCRFQCLHSWLTVSDKWYWRASFQSSHTQRWTVGTRLRSGRWVACWWSSTSGCGWGGDSVCRSRDARFGALSGS